MSADNSIIHAWNTSSINERIAFIELVIAKFRILIPFKSIAIGKATLDSIASFDLPNSKVAAPQK